ELNNSGVRGSAVVTLDDTDPMRPTIRVQINATGLTPDLPHPQHIHGNFTVQPTIGMNGPFFSGEGGTATDSFSPTIATDRDGDGFIEVAEGQATYGPVLINLTSPQTQAPPDGTAPINNPALNLATFPTAPAGIETFDQLYVFDLTNQDQRRQYHNLIPLDLREIVIHGLLVTSTAGGGTPGEIDGTPGYKATLPVASAELMPAATPAPTPIPIPTGVVGPNNLFLNISTRLRTEGGDDVMIAGFIVRGNTDKTVVIRGIGPSLAVNGTPIAGSLQDPTLELHADDGRIITVNDNWKDTQESQLARTDLAPSDDREAAIFATLAPGGYTAILKGKNGTNGVGLVEVYDGDGSSDAKLYNISTRGKVGLGDNVMIAGFIVGGPDSARALVRGLGPSISVNGTPLAGTLADPTLALYDGNGMQIGYNNDWKDTQRGEIEATMLAPTNDREAAIVSDFRPGNYTAVLSGNNSEAGIGLVESYKLN
ncbi:MAG: CHRD domain-containing protein, partial [Chthoniobacterales bacterium]